MSSEDSVSYETRSSLHHHKFAVLTLKPGNSQHLFTKDLISDFRDQLKKATEDPQVKGLITTHEGAYFSEGFDYQPNTVDQELLEKEFKELIADFIKLRFPTVARVSGRAHKAGFTLALIHDYLVLTNDDNVSLLHDELANGHAVPPYAVALVRDKFPLLPSLELLLSNKPVKPPNFDPISDYVKPYIESSIEDVVDNLLEPMVPLVGPKYGEVRKNLLPHVWELVNAKKTRGSSYV